MVLSENPHDFISKKRRHTANANISFPCEVTSSAIIEKWDDFLKHLRSYSRILSAAISKISFWIVLLTYLAFFGPEMRCSLRSVLNLASNLKIEIKLPSLYVGGSPKLILSCW